MKYIIVAASYDENSGGKIALHKLCHLINEIGGTAVLYPYTTEHPLTINGVWRWLVNLVRIKYSPFKTNVKFNTPIIRSLTKEDKLNTVVIYPEIVSGNPLGGRNIVRWFLHHPGYHSGKINYGRGELYFSYGSFGLDFSLQGSKLSSSVLEVTHFFQEYYNMDGALEFEKRVGTAYCLRKGKGRDIVHDLRDSILIDGMNHKQISDIFKKVKYFVSYDLYTAYTWFAILCGCIPIVIPDENIPKDIWLGKSNVMQGVAYGFEEILVAANQSEIARENILNKDFKTIENVRVFINETKSFFK